MFIHGGQQLDGREPVDEAAGPEDPAHAPVPIDENGRRRYGGAAAR